MLFSEVIGNEATKERIAGAVQQNRLSHAQLFLAPEGAGGLPMAMAFAQYVVCINRQGNESCGQCDQCRKAAQYIHPDIHYSYPVIPRHSGDKPLSTHYIAEWREFLTQFPYGNTYDWLQFINAENRQGNITAAECLDIIRKLNLKSFESNYKILIMWRPEYLGNEGNRLLKMIEEPPANTLFILVAENQEQVLNTILSRTQLVKIGQPSREDIAQALVSRLHIEKSKAMQLATLSAGNYREALRQAQQAESDWMQELRDWLNYIVRKQSRELLQWIERIASSKVGRENQKQFLKYFINILEHALRAQFIPPEELRLPPEEQDFALRLQKLADPLQISDMIGELEAACYHIERNANGKILFHALSIRLQYIFARKEALVL